jgi:hypothetical protein
MRAEAATKFITLSSAALMMLLPAACPLRAAAESSRIGIEANTSFWWVVSEQVENGLLQAGSLDAAADQASGFNFKQGRLAFSFESPNGRIEAFIRLRLEERTDVIDFWGSYRAAPWLTLSIGQMKIPSTAEVLTPDHGIDFITRTTFGRNVGDFALSRTPYISSVMAAKSYDRDLGISLRGAYPDEDAPLVGYFLMVGNGIGANKYIGGGESDEFLYTNRFGDFYYGARIEGSPVRWITIGAHASRNRHDDAALGARGPVYDLDRTVWTADLEARLPWGQRIDGFYGRGSMDDFIESQRYRFDYSGWGAWSILPLFEDRLELCLRYDVFTTEFNEDGNETSQKNWTAGLNYSPEEFLRFQMNYMHKEKVNEFEPDLDDDIIFFNVQFLFDAFLAR